MYSSYNFDEKFICLTCSSKTFHFFTISNLAEDCLWYFDGFYITQYWAKNINKQKHGSLLASTTFYSLIFCLYLSKNVNLCILTKKYIYRKVANSNMSCFEALPGFFRLLRRVFSNLMYSDLLTKSWFPN